MGEGGRLRCHTPKEINGGRCFMDGQHGTRSGEREPMSLSKETLHDVQNHVVTFKPSPGKT